MSEVARFSRFLEDVLGLDLEPFQQRIASVFSERRDALILLHPRWRQRTATYASRESGGAAIRWEADPIHPPPMLFPSWIGPAGGGA